MDNNKRIEELVLSVRDKCEIGINGINSLNKVDRVKNIYSSGMYLSLFSLIITWSALTVKALSSSFNEVVTLSILLGILFLATRLVYIGEVHPSIETPRIRYMLIPATISLFLSFFVGMWSVCISGALLIYLVITQLLALRNKKYVFYRKSYQVVHSTLLSTSSFSHMINYFDIKLLESIFADIEEIYNLDPCNDNRELSSVINKTSDKISYLKSLGDAPIYYHH